MKVWNLYENKKGEWEMKKMKKMLAVFMAITLVASIMVGVRETNTVEASEESIELSNWTFVQGGMSTQQKKVTKVILTRLL